MAPPSLESGKHGAQNVKARGYNAINDHHRNVGAILVIAHDAPH